MNENHQIIKNTIHKIYIELNDIESNDFDNYSLHFGKSGLLIFYVYYFKLFKNKETLKKIDQLVEEITTSLSEESNPLNFSHGIFGMVWALKHTNKMFENEFFDEAEFSTLDNEIIHLLKSLLDNGDDDFMHGGLGAILSLNKSLLAKNTKTLYEQILSLSMFEKNQKYIWLDILKNGENINLGLAHGQLSYWYFLNYLAQIDNSLLQKTNQIIEDSYKTICEFKTSNGLFPSYGVIVDNQIIKNETYSKLSWCYGDLAMSNTLILLGKSLKNDFLYNEGIELGIKTTVRSTFIEANINDLCLCHGASSCVMIYNVLYQNTGKEIFHSAMNNWINQSIEHYSAGIDLFCDHEKKTSKYPSSLLNGKVGLGLTLISTLDPSLNEWNQSILLS